MPLRVAETVRVKVEALLASTMAGAVDAETARWVGSLEDGFHLKLARLGLVQPRSKHKKTIADLLDAYFEVLNVKPGTAVTYLQTRRSLEDHFSKGRLLSIITSLDAARWRQGLEDEGLAVATISKRVKTARQIFKLAVQWKLVPENPFSDIRAGTQRNGDRLVFVPRASVEAVLEATSDPQWRLLIALARYGGLRVPSEALALKWEHVDWGHGRLTIPSSKTEGQGKASRVIPMFPELKPYLLAAFEAAKPGEEYLVTRCRNPGVNLRTQLQRLLARAGVQAWPRLWQNLRSSRATELAEQYPSHVAAAWCGHSEAVARAHYWKVRDEDFDKALASGDANSGAHVAHIEARYPAAPERTEPQKSAEAFGGCGLVPDGAEPCTSVQDRKVTPMGSEQSTNPSGNRPSSKTRGAKCGASRGTFAPAPAGGGLANLVDAWSELPPAIKKAVAALVDAGRS